MSGDVQPKKRKDKRRKKADDTAGQEETTVQFSASSTNEDFNIHVHDDHGTGGGICAKFTFFGLFSALIVFIGLILVENRGLTDLDTTTTESRFAKVFDGWIDESIHEHEEGHTHVTLENIHETEDTNNNEENHSDGNAEKQDDEQWETNKNEESDITNESNEESGMMHESNEGYYEQASEENLTTEDVGKDETEEKEISYEEETEEEEEAEHEVEEDKVEENNDDSDEENDDNTSYVNNELNFSNEEKTENSNELENNIYDNSNEPNDISEENDDDNDDNDNTDDQYSEENIQDDAADEPVSSENEILENIDEDIQEEVIDNNAEEEYLSNTEETQDEVKQESSNVAINIGVGVGLVVVAYIVLIRKWKHNGVKNVTEEIKVEVISDLSRRNTIVPPGAYEEKDVNNFEDDLNEKIHDTTNNEQAKIKLTETYLQEQQLNINQIEYGRADAEFKRKKDVLSDEISLYDILHNTEISNHHYLQVAGKSIHKLRCKGHYYRAIQVHNELIKRFPNTPEYRNQLAVTYLSFNRFSEAKQILKEVLFKWPEDGFALAHYGFILKVKDNDLTTAIKYLKAGIESKVPGVIDGRFYFHLGDALTRLRRNTEAMQVYEDGAKNKVFLSKYQRSLYNINRLTAKPWWPLNKTPHNLYFKLLEENWKIIREEGLTLLSKTGYFKDESENLRDTGEWKEFILFSKGQKLINNCSKCPQTCKLIEKLSDAKSCRRGQIKFSVMHPGTHVWPHCGPSNCRLRAHLGLQIPSNTFIRVADEIRSWREGKMFLFDDSFEHEVWHNGSDIRLILIVDVWHHDLTELEKESLPEI